MLRELSFPTTFYATLLCARTEGLVSNGDDFTEERKGEEGENYESRATLSARRPAPHHGDSDADTAPGKMLYDLTDFIASVSVKRVPGAAQVGCTALPTGAHGESMVKPSCGSLASALPTQGA